MTSSIYRVILYLGLLALVMVAVSAVFSLDSTCDECCATGTCSDCQDCHCASTTSFVLTTFEGSEFCDELTIPNEAPSQVFPDRDWCSDFYRPPRLLYI